MAMTKQTIRLSTAGAKRKNDADGDAPSESNKKSKLEFSKPPKRTDEDGNTYWELTSKRRMTISSFKGQTFLGIRDFYEKDGKLLPGKAGINLKLDQVASLILALPEVREALKQTEGIELPVENGEVIGVGDEAGVEDDHEGGSGTEDE